MRPILGILTTVCISYLALATGVTAARPGAGPANGPAGAAAVSNALALDKWFYIQVDGGRSARAFGLDMGDATGDGFGDIVSGRYFYRNPGDDMTGAWTRVTLPDQVDAVLVMDVDGDDRADVIAQKTIGTNLTFYWLEANDGLGGSWTNVTAIGSVPQASHALGSQGHRLAQVEAGGAPEVVVSSGNGLYYFEVPANPSAGNWPVTHVNANPTDEGFGVGDVDGDDDLDLAAGTGNTKRVEWYENPGDGSEGWTAHHIGDMAEANWTDRFAIADLDGDGSPDIVGTEENGSSSGAETWWWEQPGDPTSGNWTRRLIVSQGSTNSMDVADMDDDGDVDVVLAEHRGSLKLAVWENDGAGSFTERVVDTGKESHLGAKVTDLDGDGDMEIVSIAWDAYQNLHLWRNDAAGDLSPALLQSYSAAYNEAERAVEVAWRLADVGEGMRFFVLRADGKGAPYHPLPDPDITGGDMTYSVADRSARPGASYRYRVDVTDELGRRALFETVAVEIPLVDVTLEAAVPNPFNPQTTIAYAIPDAGRLVLTVYDAAGRPVRSLVDRVQAAGRGEATWDGRDDVGRPVSSGVYFVRLQFDGRTQTQKLMLLK